MPPVSTQTGERYLSSRQTLRLSLSTTSRTYCRQARFISTVPQYPKYGRQAPAPHVHYYTRLYSTSPSPRESTSTEPSRAIARQKAYERLRPIIDELPEDIDWAVAYGSGAIHQANASSGPPPMTDFLISTSDPTRFHSRNMSLHPDHYPLWARIGGAGRVADVQDTWGAGVWYVTAVRIKGLEVKYGVISTERLVEDLKSWKTLYVAGRLHKPVLNLKTTDAIDSAQETNSRSALAFSLLLLPERFTEYQLWEQIAGISYSGDPRMSVPGAENPQKVKNIVRGSGNLQGFREMYGDLISAIGGITWAQDSHSGNETLEKAQANDAGISATSSWSWKGDGEEKLVQATTSNHYSHLIESLPTVLQQSLQEQYPESIGTGHAKSAESLDSKADSWDNRYDWKQTVQDQAFRNSLLATSRNIIHGPALRQSIKGLVTAGLTKSVYYSLAKFRKWFQARAKAK